MYKKGYYYLFYSSGWYSDPHYNVRVAKSKSPTGPFIKKKFPVLETNWIPYNKGVNTTFVGPGHCSVVSWWRLVDDISLLDVRRCEHRVSGESCVHGQDQVEEWLADHWITQHGENSGTKTLNINT